MNKLPLVIYTHTDMKDVWPSFFGQLNKFMPDYKLYVCVNEIDKALPENCLQITYDDSKKYTNRILECLDKINEDVILFFHEDMILYSNPLHVYLEKYYEYILTDKANSIKLLYAGSGGTKSEFEDTLVQNDLSKFSIQPTIIKTKTFKELIENHLELTIYEFEDAIKLNEKDFSATNGIEKKRGIFHYDSFVFPYIATAINKGKWNLTEYQTELNPIFEEYNINPFDRGIW